MQGAGGNRGASPAEPGQESENMTPVDRWPWLVGQWQCLRSMRCDGGHRRMLGKLPPDWENPRSKSKRMVPAGDSRICAACAAYACCSSAGRGQGEDRGASPPTSDLRPPSRRPLSRPAAARTHIPEPRERLVTTAIGSCCAVPVTFTRSPERNETFAAGTAAQLLS